jgi:predicted ATP-dependent endonuclease of OLD family
MESNHFIEKLAKWDLILNEYDFGIVHKVVRVNRDANGLSWNSSFNKEDIFEACCHSDRNLKVVPC